MPMDNSTQEMCGRIAEGISQNWIPAGNEINPDFGKFSVKQLLGQGATSLSYQIQFAAEEGAGRSFFIKKYTDETRTGLSQLERDYKAGNWLSAEIGSQSALSIDAPVLMILEDRVLVTPYVSGQNLSPYFFKKLRWHFISKGDLSELKGIAGDIGRGLADLQNLPIETSGLLFDKSDPQLMFSRLKVELENFRVFYSVRNICQGLVEKVISRMEACLEEYLLGEPTCCFQHCDYILQNFIWGDNGKLHLFDFANSRVGTPYFDIAHLINSFEDLTYLKTVSGSIVDQFIRAFLQPFLEKDSFKTKLLCVTRAYFQLHSGRIVLAGKGVARKRSWRNTVMVDPEKRLKEKLLVFLEELES